MEIKHNILFFVDKEKGKEDAKLRLRIRWNKHTINFNVGHRVFTEKWNSETQRCKKNTTNSKKVSASIINSKIQKMHDIAENVFKHYELKETFPTVEQFREQFNVLMGRNKTSKSTKTGFYDFFDLFTLERGKQNSWTEATYEKFAA